jgi:hypothetical protein
LFSAVATAAPPSASFGSPLRNVPGSQAEHFGSPGRLLLPGSQEMHTDDFATEYCPLGQLVHTPRPLSIVPAKHLPHSNAPSSDALPPGH